MTGASPERWREIDRIVDAALDVAEDARAHYVRSACGSDAALRTDVERLLRSCEDASDFLERPAAEFASPLVDAAAGMEPASEGTRVGPYRVVREAGRGGMGTVYVAERDDEQYRQQVALKVVRRGFDADPSVVRRFVEERQILASLEHPNIARLLDGGVTANGLPYFAMEYVAGTPIDRYCDERRLPIETRLRLFESVCDAVQYAHRRLVVHRDLKPTNILVTDDGTVKLLDFGIAKLLAPDVATERVETIAGLRLMTPEYASPEQLRGERVSTASDVYSLGVLLYELLAGRRPGIMKDRASDGARRAPTRALEGEEVTRPSAALANPTTSPTASSVADARSTTVARLRRSLQGDLDTIVMMAMRTEPERRYGTAEQFGADVRRYLTRRPVSARPDTLSYRVQRFVRRNRAGVAGAAVIVLLLAASTVITGLQSARIARERDIAEGVSSFLVGLFTAADPYESPNRELTARALLDSGAARVTRELAGQPATRAHLTATIGRAYYGLGRYSEARVLLEQALAQRRILVGRTDTNYARTAHLLATVRLDQGDRVAAESLFRSTLELRRALLGSAHPDVAISLRGVGQALRARGELQQAEPMLREALAIQRRQRPVNALDVAATLNALAHVRRERGDLGEAATFYREVYALRRPLLGDDHPDVANSLVNVGATLVRGGDLAAAEPLIRQGIASKQRSLGDDHPDVATDMSALAYLLKQKGDVTGAESMYRETLKRQRRVLPRGHVRTAPTLLGLGEILIERGEAGKAEPLVREALGIEQRLLPASNPRVAEAQGLLARCLVSLGRDREAEPLLLASFSSLRAAHGTSDSRTEAARQRIIGLYERAGRAHDAARYRTMQ